MPKKEVDEKKLTFTIKKNLCVFSVGFMCIMSSFNGLKSLQVGLVYILCPVVCISLMEIYLCVTQSI